MRIQSDHLDEVNQTYTAHANDALKISFKMLITSFKMFIHAISPDIFSTAASDIAREIINETDKKKNDKSE